MMFLVVVDFSRSIYHHLEGKFYFALPANTLLTIWLNNRLLNTFSAAAVSSKAKTLLLFTESLDHTDTADDIQ